MPLERAWKHFSRAISKPFTGANIANLQQLDQVMLAADSHGYRKVPASVLRHGEFDFTWIEALTAAEFRDFRSEWIAAMQAQAPTLQVSTRVQVSNQLSAAVRTKLMQDRNRTAMWNAMQNIKDRYRTLAKSKVEGFFARQKRKIEEMQTSLSDKVHQNPVLGVYLSYYDAATTSFEHGSVDGATTDEQRSLLAAGGLYKCLKNGFSAAQGVVRAVVTAGADLSAVKTAVVSGVKALNSLGGLLAGIVDLASGRDADWRGLSARFGLEQSIEQLSQRLQGRAQESFAAQVTSGPQALARGASLTEEDMLALRKELRHSFYWVQVFEKDIEAIEEELKTTDLQRELNHVLTHLRSASDDNSVVKPSLISGLGAVEAPKKEALLKQVTEAKQRVARFKGFMQGDLNKLDAMLAAVESRRGIAATQRSAVEAGLQFDAPRTLAQAAASFDKSQLKPVVRTAAAPTVLSQIREYDRSRLKSAALRELNPAPATAPTPTSTRLDDILHKAAAAHASRLTAAALLPSAASAVSEEWDTA